MRVATSVVDPTLKLVPERVQMYWFLPTWARDDRFAGPTHGGQTQPALEREHHSPTQVRPALRPEPLSFQVAPTSLTPDSPATGSSATAHWCSTLRNGEGRHRPHPAPTPHPPLYWPDHATTHRTGPHEAARSPLRRDGGTSLSARLGRRALARALCRSTVAVSV